MYVVAIAWLYVVVLMAMAEAVSDHGSWLGAFITLLFYGLLPLGVVLYLMGAPSRRASRSAQALGSAPVDPAGDGGGHAPGDAVATKREEA